MTSSSTFPTSEDSIPRTSPTDTLSGHSDLHDQVADAVEKIENKVGIDGDTNVDSHDYKIAQLETGQTAAQLLTKIKTVDGTGSGLDADTVDGSHASAFATSGHNHNTAYAALSHNHNTAYAALSHNHNSDYYTETEVNTLLANKQDSSTALTTTTTFGGDVSGTYNAISLKVAFGKETVTTNGNGHASIAHGLGSNITNAAVFVAPREELSDDSDVMLACAVTGVTTTNINFRAYEFDGSTTGTGGNTISSVYSTSFDVSWFAIYP